MLCTDGLANVGLGALDDLQNDEQRQVAESFYEELGREVCMCMPLHTDTHYLVDRMEHLMCICIMQ